MTAEYEAAVLISPLSAPSSYSQCLYIDGYGRVINVVPNLIHYFLILDVTLFPAIPTAAAAPTFLTTFRLTVLPPLLLPSIAASSESLRSSLDLSSFLMVKSFFSDPLMDGFFWESDHAGIVTDNKINKNVVSTIWPVTEIDTFIVFF